MNEQESRGYPIKEDMGFQKRSWLAERIAWVIIIGLPIVGLSGLFTHGFVSAQTVGDPSQVQISYERFQRITRQVQFHITVASGNGNETMLRLGPGFTERYEITDIEPRPLRTTSRDGTAEFTFARPIDGRLSVVIWTHPRKVGPRTYELAAGDKRLTFWTLVYP